MKKPLTLRVNDAERVALKNLSRIEGRTVNQLLNDAIKVYLGRVGRKERTWKETLEALRQYRKQNGGFERAVDAFVEAEVAFDDPLEEELLEESVNGQTHPAGPVQNKMRKLLGA